MKVKAVKVKRAHYFLTDPRKNKVIFYKRIQTLQKHVLKIYQNPVRVLNSLTKAKSSIKTDLITNRTETIIPLFSTALSFYDEIID